MPIACSKCSKQAATVHVTEILDGEKKTVHLCEDCARETGETFKATISIPDILSELVGGEAMKEMSELAGIECPKCGMSYQDFRSGGRLGCPHDYTVFRKGLLPFIEKIHGSTQHAGKYPRSVGTSFGGPTQQKIFDLHQELTAAVKDEEYEKAAQLRDRIRELKKEAEDGSR